MLLIAMEYCPFSSVTTTGRLVTTPVPKIADCGRKTTGVSNSAPREPVLVRVKVPPDNSSGLSLFSLVLDARSEICCAIALRLSVEASRITGVSKPNVFAGVVNNVFTINAGI